MHKKVKATPKESWRMPYPEDIPVTELRQLVKLISAPTIPDELRREMECKTPAELLQWALDREAKYLEAHPEIAPPPPLRAPSKADLERVDRLFMSIRKRQP